MCSVRLCDAQSLTIHQSSVDVGISLVALTSNLCYIVNGIVVGWQEGHQLVKVLC